MQDFGSLAPVTTERERDRRTKISLYLSLLAEALKHFCLKIVLFYFIRQYCVLMVGSVSINDLKVDQGV